MQTEKRNKMVGCHMTEREKQFLRVHAAQEGNTISDVLSKVEGQNNPFFEIKNKQ